MTARQEVLNRVRRAIGESQHLAVARRYRTTGDYPPGAPELIELLAGRLLDYRARVVRCGHGDAAIAGAIAGILDHEADPVVVAPGVPEAWLPPARRRADNPPLSWEDLDAAPGVLTGCAVVMAETGTIVLDGSPPCGRRALTLIPDRHICVVRGDQIVHSVPEGLARLDPTTPLTFISGPSATSDIELQRVEGVHGPRRLVVVVAG